jgi:hypothetical protein
MLRKVWQLRSLLFLLALLAAFAACIKQRDPEQDMKDLRARVDQVAQAINNKDLGQLNEYYIQPAPAAKGPNALLAEIATKVDDQFIMHKQRVSVDRDQGSVRFTFTNNPEDSTFSFINFRRDDGWKITDYEIY